MDDVYKPKINTSNKMKFAVIIIMKEGFKQKGKNWGKLKLSNIED